MANEFKIKKGLIVTGASGGTVVDIQGSQGQLFSVTDDLSGSIFAVSDISGVPILDVNSSGLVTIDGPFTQTGGGDSNFSGDVNIKSVFDFDTATDLFSITNNQNTGGINLSGNNSRIYFGGNRAIEGAQGSTNLTFAEGYTSSYFQSNVNVTGDVALTGSSKYIYLRTGTNSGLWQEDDFSLRFGTNNIEALELDNVQNATFAAQAFSAATSSGDDSSTLTTKGYVDGLITGATIYRGAWDPSGGGYGSPDLSGVTQTSGYYYICSADGTAEPNGTGTEPDTWAVGDWVIYNDVSGTGQWQKIDNSSVLSGVGTGQTVALWEGAGSVTDSETLGNAPITVSGNDTTFAGNITFGDSHFIGDDADDNLLIQSSANENVIINSPDDDLLFRTAGTTRLQITNTLFSVAQNATFAGDLTVNGDVLLGGSAAAPKTITIQQIGVTTTDANAVMQDGNGVLKIRTLGTGAFGPTPVGAYLPLSAGSSYPLTDSLYIGSGGANGLILKQDTSAGSNSGRLFFQTDTAAEGVCIMNANGVLTFRTSSDPGATSGNVKMVLTNGGNLGIGVTTTGAKLQIDKANANSSVIISRSGTNLSTSTGVGSITFSSHYNSAYADYAVIQAYSNNLSAVRGSLDLKVKSTSGTLLTGMTLYGTSSGVNVGIGTATPGTKLEVDGDIGIGRVAGGYTFRETVGGSERASIKSNATNELIFSYGASTEAMRIDDSGNVGIGTTSPSSFGATYKVLDLYGTNAMYAINTVGGIFGQINAANTDALYIGTRSNHKIHLTTNNSNALTILTDGKVGIGTTSPSAKLEVLGVNNDAILTLSRGNASQYLTFRGYQMASNGNHMLVSADDTKQVWVGHQSTTAELVVDVGGNVGIGTTSPGYLLDLSKTAVSVDTYSGINLQASNYGYTIEGGLTQNVGGELIFSSNNAGTRAPRVKFAANGNVGIGTTTPNAKLDIQGTQGQLFSVTDNLSGSIFAVADISGVPIFDVNSSGVSYFDGSLGIGTTPSSGTKLEVNGQTIINSTNVATGLAWFNNQTEIFSFEDNSGGGRLLLSDTTVKVAISANSNSYFNGGNVGIGTTSPDSKLDVTGGDITVNTSGVGFMNFKYGSVGSEAIMGSIQTTGIDLKINATSDLLLLPGSNVGIGITNPSAKLEVLGQDIEFYSGTGSQSLQLGRNANERLEMYVNDNMGKITAIQDADGNGTHDFILNRIFGGTGANNFMIQKDGSTQLLVDTNGNVGIGTTSPAYPLDVVGTANIDTIIAGNPGNLTIGLAGTKGTFLTGMMQTNYIMHCSGSASNLAFTNGNTNSNALTFSRGSISGTVASIGSISMTATSTSYNTTSDYRLKENEEKISNAIDRLKNLKPIRFNWILEPEEEKVDGFLAHEVAEVVPEAVTGEKDAIDYKGDDDLQMLENSKLVPLLTAALQQAIDKIELLEQRIQSIENK